MIDLINRLRDQREELKLKRFEDGGGVSPIKAGFQQIKPFFNNMFARVDMGDDSENSTSNPFPVVASNNNTNNSDAGNVDYSLAPGLSGYTPPTKPLSLATPYAGLNGNQTTYQTGSDAEKAAKQQQDLQNKLTTSNKTTTTTTNKDNQDRASLLTSLLASQGTSSLEGSLFGLGRALKVKPGTTGKGMAVAGYGLSAFLGGAGKFMLGRGSMNQEQMNQDWNREALAQSQNVYNNATQFQNANTTGGTAQGRYGGMLSYEDGGNATFNESEEGDKTLEYKKIAQQLSEQYPTIEELDEYLQSEGVPEEDHQGILEQAQQIYGGEMQPEQEDMDEEEGEQQSFREGGEAQGPKASFNKKVGDEIHFQYGGKTHKGTISKIENGKIYL
jgi:hypothetical protein